MNGKAIEQQGRPITRPTPIEQKGQSEQKGKKTGEGYRSVMVETKLMVAHIHEREDNRATGKREEKREWESGDGDGGGELKEK